MNSKFEFFGLMPVRQDVPARFVVENKDRGPRIVPSHRRGHFANQRRVDLDDFG